jgi:hypothetical protein
MLKYFKLMIFLFGFTLFGCDSDYEIHNIPDIVTEIKIPDDPGEVSKLDVLLVLDNSCSMMKDWSYISYGLTQIPEELNDYGLDWKLAITSMDPADGSFIEIPFGDDPGWDMIAGVENLRDVAGATENGFDGALRAKDENPRFFRVNAITLIVFVSDETEQSEMSYEDFHANWGSPHMIASIVGPETQEGTCANAAPKYHAVSQVTIDICTLEPWSLVDLVME